MLTFKCHVPRRVNNYTRICTSLLYSKQISTLSGSHSYVIRVKPLLQLFCLTCLTLHKFFISSLMAIFISFLTSKRGSLQVKRVRTFSEYTSSSKVNRNLVQISFSKFFAIVSAILFLQRALQPLPFL
jgi:hypothetical protein